MEALKSITAEDKFRFAEVKAFIIFALYYGFRIITFNGLNQANPNRRISLFR